MCFCIKKDVNAPENGVKKLPDFLWRPLSRFGIGKSLWNIKSNKSTDWDGIFTVLVCSRIGPGTTEISAVRWGTGILKYFKKKRRNTHEITERKYIYYNKIVSLNVNFENFITPLSGSYMTRNTGRAITFSCGRRYTIFYSYRR